MELYRKVIIKDENDLPKETGGYFVFHSTFGVQGEFYNNDLDSKVKWLECFDWYLLPIEQEPQKEVVSAEEILNPHIHIEDDEQYPFPYVRPSCALKAMEEYASQFQTEQRQVTDEQENKLVELYLNHSLCIANVCDEVLDRSGALLGRIRDKAIAMYNGKIKSK